MIGELSATELPTALPVPPRTLCQSNDVLRLQFDQRLLALRDEVIKSRFMAQAHVMLSALIVIASVAAVFIFADQFGWSVSDVLKQFISVPGTLAAVIYTTSLIALILLLLAMGLYSLYILVTLQRLYEFHYSFALQQMVHGDWLYAFTHDEIKRLAEEQLTSWLPVRFMPRPAHRSFERDLEYCACQVAYLAQTTRRRQVQLRALWHELGGQVGQALFHLQWLFRASAWWYLCVIVIALFLPPVPLALFGLLLWLGPRYITSRAVLAAFIDVLLEQPRIEVPAAPLTGKTKSLWQYICGL